MRFVVNYNKPLTFSIKTYHCRWTNIKNKSFNNWRMLNMGLWHMLALCFCKSTCLLRFKLHCDFCIHFLLSSSSLPQMNDQGSDIDIMLAFHTWIKSLIIHIIRQGSYPMISCLMCPSLLTITSSLVMAILLKLSLAIFQLSDKIAINNNNLTLCSCNISPGIE